ncbi:MAG: acyltransferase family protein [Bacteroidales bacterium]|nr:acyltransferase family protein [Bacteroidales bacterium]
MEKIETLSSLYFSDRIDFLDLLKGFAILWIVWYNQPHPGIIDHYYHVPIFFFISGIFFKQKPPKQFFRSIFYRIIIPFIFFYFVSFIFQIARFCFENHAINGFEWTCIFDIFRIESYIDHITINRPLWFLIALIIIQSMYYIIGRLPKWFILSICIIIILFKNQICSLQTPLLINQSVFWMSYFALGDIVGKWLISITIFERKWKVVLAIVCISLFAILSFLIPHINNSLLYNTTYEISVISFVILSVLFFSFIKGKGFTAQTFRFYGQNSLIVLGLHMLISIVYGGIFFRLFGITGDNLIGFANFILTTATLYPIILFLNKYLPLCVGKKKET